MLVDFNFKHLDTIYPIRSMMIWHFFTNNMTKYRNLTPFTHYFHFILFHAVSVKISFNYLLWRASLFCLSKFNILFLFFPIPITSFNVLHLKNCGYSGTNRSCHGIPSIFLVNYTLLRNVLFPRDYSNIIKKNIFFWFSLYIG